MKLLITFLLGIVLFGSSLAASALDWRSLESENFILYYNLEDREKAEAWLHRLEVDRQSIAWESGSPTPKIPVVLEDYGLYANGSVTVFPFRMNLGVTPPFNHQALAHYRNWPRLLVSHELAHAQQFAEVSKHAKTITKLFGTYFLPNIHTPTWLMEGYALTLESAPQQTESGPEPFPQGRLNDGRLHNILAKEVHFRQLRSLESLTSNLQYRYPYDYMYLYGGKFMQYLSKTYGEESLSKFIKYQGENVWAPLGQILPYLTIDKAAKKAFGDSFPNLYRDWQHEVRNEYSSWSITGSKVSNPGWHKPFTETDGSKVYFVNLAPIKSAPLALHNLYHINEYDPETNTTKIKQSLLSPVLNEIEVHDGYLYYLQAQLAPGYNNITNYGFGSKAQLKRLNLNTGKVQSIIEGDIVDFTVLEDGRILFSRANHTEISTQLILLEEGQQKDLGEIPYLVKELRAHQNAVYVVAKTYERSYNLYELDLASMDLSVILETPWTVSHLKAHENDLLFTLNRGNTSSLYGFNIFTNVLTHKTESDFARAGVIVKDQTFFVGLDETGEALYQHPNFSLVTSIETEPATPGNFPVLQGATYHKDAVAQSSKALLDPYSKALPALLLIQASPSMLPPIIGGADDLGLTNYNISVNADSGFTYSISSQFFQPTLVGLTGNGDDHFLFASHPFYRSIQKGIRSVQGSVRTDFDQFIAGVYVSHQLPYNDSSLLAETDITGDGFLARLNHTTYWQGDQSISARFTSATNTDTFLRVRGDYFDIVDNADGFAFSVDYQYKLKELQRGIWSPSIFWGDLYAGIFVDYADYSSSDRAYGRGIRDAYGSQLSFETSIFQGNLALIQNIGYAYVNNEATLFLDFSASIDF